MKTNNQFSHASPFLIGKPHPLTRLRAQVLAWVHETTSSALPHLRQPLILSAMARHRFAQDKSADKIALIESTILKKLFRR